MPTGRLDRPQGIVGTWPPQEQENITCVEMDVHLRDHCQRGAGNRQRLDAQTETSITRLLDDIQSINLKIWFVPPFHKFHFDQICLKPLYDVIVHKRILPLSGYSDANRVLSYDWLPPKQDVVIKNAQDMASDASSPHDDDLPTWLKYQMPPNPTRIVGYPQSVGGQEEEETADPSGERKFKRPQYEENILDEFDDDLLGPSY